MIYIPTPTTSSRSRSGNRGTSTTTTNTASRSLLTRLRSLTPSHNQSTFPDALWVAERQAARLVAHLATGDHGVTEQSVTAAVPRLRVIRDELPVSGTSHWNGRVWVICLNRSDSPARQRFTLLHELKHVIDHGASGRLYRGSRLLTASRQTERAADYFAGCVLVSKRSLKAIWGQGLHDPVQLARYFGVSVAAIQVRLDQTGLSRVRDPEYQPRCGRPVNSDGTHQFFRIATSPTPSSHRRRSYV